MCITPARSRAPPLPQLRESAHTFSAARQPWELQPAQRPRATRSWRSFWTSMQSLSSRACRGAPLTLSLGHCQAAQRLASLQHSPAHKPCSQQDVLPLLREGGECANCVIIALLSCRAEEHAHPGPSQKEALSHYDIQDIVVVELVRAASRHAARSAHHALSALQDDRSDGGAVQASVKNLTGRGTVPSVFIGGSCIGGGDETAAMHRSGKLEGALQAANALK